MPQSIIAAMVAVVEVVGVAAQGLVAATVTPGAEFSFLVFNIDKPEQVSVTVKNIPVEVTAEFKDPYYLFKGKLPASLVSTAARINIKVNAKSPHCEAENGWLLKISDK